MGAARESPFLEIRRPSLKKSTFLPSLWTWMRHPSKRDLVHQASPVSGFLHSVGWQGAMKGTWN
jgi:hypothetical protein